jgi:hypothetical protein
MANGYTVVPNILPGNVTVGGNLTVNGGVLTLTDTVLQMPSGDLLLNDVELKRNAANRLDLIADILRVGAALPFVRIGKTSTALSIVSHNMDTDFTTRDNAALPAYSIGFNPALLVLALRRINAAGNFHDEAITDTLFTDYTIHNHTGTTTQDTIYTKTIRGNLLGANGGIRVVIKFLASTQGAPNTAIKIVLGGTILYSFLFGTTGDIFCDGLIANRNATNSQVGESLMIGPATNTTLVSTLIGAVDTTADQTLTVTIQSGTATDVQRFDACVMTLLNTFGPVT